MLLCLLSLSRITSLKIIWFSSQQPTPELWGSLLSSGLPDLSSGQGTILGRFHSLLFNVCLGLLFMDWVLSDSSMSFLIHPLHRVWSYIVLFFLFIILNSQSLYITTMCKMNYPTSHSHWLELSVEENYYKNVQFSYKIVRAGMGLGCKNSLVFRVFSLCPNFIFSLCLCSISSFSPLSAFSIRLEFSLEFLLLLTIQKALNIRSNIQYWIVRQQFQYIRVNVNLLMSFYLASTWIKLINALTNFNMFKIGHSSKWLLSY